MSKALDHSAAPLAISPSTKMNKLLHGLHDNSRRKLQDTASSELDRIRSYVERELERKRRVEKIEDEHLTQRKELLREVEERIEKTGKLREDSIKRKKDDLKFFHTKHKERVQAKVQVRSYLIVGR